MSAVVEDKRARLQRWLASGEARLQPLTFPQRELWKASPVAATDPAHHICAIATIRGVVSREHFEAAMAMVVARQEVLRLSILPGKTQPVQLLRKSAPSAVSFRDLSAGRNDDSVLEETVRALVSRPFDLVNGPLYRLEIVCRSERDHCLILVIHHAIADGWTLGVFMSDLWSAYAKLVFGKAGGLPSLPMSYTEWGAAERLRWQPSELEERGRFWKKFLSGASSLWEAPAASRSLSGVRKRCRFTMPKPVARAARDMALQSGVTLFSGTLAAFQVALAKWTGKTDILVGTPVAQRAKEAVRQTMGYFAGVVPLRSKVDFSATFGQHLDQVHRMTVDCFANSMPFVELAHCLGNTWAPGQNPVFEVRFALQNHPLPDVSLPGLDIQYRTQSTGTPRFDLACELTEEGATIEVVWLFREELYKEPDIERLHQLFLEVLSRMSQSPGDCVRSVLESDS